MARRHAAATTPEGRYIASRIQDARRRGATNRQIGDAFGINERTVRKIVAGETPGTKIFAARMPKTKRPVSSPNIIRANVTLVDNDGNEIPRSVILKAPDLPGAKGRTAPTPFDIFRIPAMRQVAQREAEAMARRYGYRGGDATITGFQTVARRGPTSKLYIIRGTASRDEEYADWLREHTINQ